MANQNGIDMGFKNPRSIPRKNPCLPVNFVSSLIEDEVDLEKIFQIPKAISAIEVMILK